MSSKAEQPTDSQDNMPGMYFGFDLSKATFEESWRPSGLPPVQLEDLRKMKTRTFARTRKGIEEWWSRASKMLEPGQRACVVMEVTSSFSLETVAWIKDVCPQVSVVVLPGKRVRSWGEGVGVCNKTDKIDARVLASFGSDRQPEDSVLPSGVYAELRALSRARVDCVEVLTAARQRLEEADRAHHDAHTAKVLRKVHGEVVRALEKQIAQLEKEMKKLIASDSQLSKDVELLDTIVGVGWYTAVSVIVELGDLRNFKRRSEVVAMAGLNPVVHSSGTSVEKRRRISKKGSSAARRVLYLAAMSTTTSKTSTGFKTMYENLIGQGKAKKVALVAVMRKILLVMRAVVRSGKAFDPNFTKA